LTKLSKQTRAIARVSRSDAPAPRLANLRELRIGAKRAARRRLAASENLIDRSGELASRSILKRADHERNRRADDGRGVIARRGEDDLGPGLAVVARLPRARKIDAAANDLAEKEAERDEGIDRLAAFLVAR